MNSIRYAFVFVIILLGVSLSLYAKHSTSEFGSDRLSNSTYYLYGSTKENKELGKSIVEHKNVAAINSTSALIHLRSCVGNAIIGGDDLNFPYALHYPPTLLPNAMIKDTCEPMAMMVSDTACTDIMGNSYFDLNSIARRVRKVDSVTVEFSRDTFFRDTIAGTFRSRGDTLYARVNNKGCYSKIVRIYLISLKTPIIDQATAVFLCDSLVLPPITGDFLTDDVAYYTQKNGRGTRYVEGDVIDSTIVLYAYDKRWICSSEVPVKITITPTPNAGDDNTISVCTGTVVPLRTLVNGEQGGIFRDLDNSNKVINGNFITIDLMGTFRFRYVLEDAIGCKGDSATLTIHVVNTVNAGRDVNNRICNNDSINLLTVLRNANPGGVFEDIDKSGALTGITIFNARKTTAGTWRILYIVGDDVTCPRDTAVITIEVLPAIDIFDPIDVQECDFFVLDTIKGIDLTGNENYYSLPSGRGLTYQVGDTIKRSGRIYLYDNTSGICTDEASFYIEIGQSSVNFINGTLCPDNFVVYNNTRYDINNPAGREILSVKNNVGCDSILIIDLSFHEPAINNIQSSLCKGSSLTINGNIYDKNNPKGIEVISNGSINGCDSTIRIDLTFVEWPVGYERRVICPEDTAIINGTSYYFNRSTGRDTLRGASVLGCDSIIEVTIAFFKTDTSISQVLCAGESLTVDGQVFDQNKPSGQVVITNGSTNGCDSIINVNLNFLNNSINFIRGDLCNGNSLLINSVVYDINRPIGRDTIPGGAANGCDSILDISLNFMDAVTNTLRPNLCNNESLLINGTTYDKNTLFGRDTLKNASKNGCDSVVVVEIQLFEPAFSTLLYDLCPGQSIVINGTTYDENNASGIEFIANGAANGCDSTINVSINYPDYFLTPRDSTIEIAIGEDVVLPFESNMPFDLISWSTDVGLSCLDCINPIASSNETTTYILTLTDSNGCQLSANITVVVRVFTDVYIPNSFTPNGDGINDNFRAFAGDNIGKINVFSIYNRWGELVYSENDTDIYDSGSHVGWDGTFKGQNLNPGVYVYLVSVQKTNGEDIVLSGSITLIR